MDHSDAMAPREGDRLFWGMRGPNSVVMPAQAGIQYAAASQSITPLSEYWIARLRGR
jgi:hypothetical protein